MKTKIVCFDLDDTVLNFSQTVCEIHNNEYETKITHHDISDWSFETLDCDGVKGKDLTATYKMFEDHGLYAILQPLEYAKHALDIARLYGYKIFFITARPEKFNLATRLSLIKHHLVWDEIIYNWDKVHVLNKLKKEYNIQLFVDDKASTINQVAENCSVKKVCLLSNNANKKEATVEDVIRVTNLMEAVRFLKDLR